jgi:hypothetical protein
MIGGAVAGEIIRRAVTRENIRRTAAGEIIRRTVTR